MTWQPRQSVFIKEVQVQLKKRGLYDGAIDGLPGKLTIAAFREHFELGLPRPCHPLRNYEGREWVVPNSYDPVKHRGWDLFLRYKTGDRPAEGHVVIEHGSPHWWIPLAQRAGSIANGGVSFTGITSRGGLVVVDHGFGLKSMYFHAYEFHVSKGQQVKQGQDVITCGHDTKHELSAGNVVHLHFACKQDGEYVDPAHVLADAVRLD